MLCLLGGYAGGWLSGLVDRLVLNRSYVLKNCCEPYLISITEDFAR
jgi:hypothetical protein